jgi:hypothetical protein
LLLTAIEDWLLIGLRCGPSTMHLPAPQGGQSCIVKCLAATASTSGAFSRLKINTRSSFAGSGKLENAMVSSQIFTMRAEKLVRLNHKKFQAAQSPSFCRPSSG